MAKKQPKAKQPIRIRFKQLANGNQSIYLDCYYNGKRSTEFLKLYLVPGKDAQSKELNSVTMRAAQAILAERLKELTNGKAGIKTSGSKLLLSAYIKAIAQKREAQNKNADTYKCCCHLVMAYKDTMLKDIDKAWCMGFFDFMRCKYVSNHTNKPLAQSSASLYTGVVSSVLNKAVRAGLMDSNPFNMIDPEDKISRGHSQRGFLEVEEVQRLMDAPCINEMVKAAFMFQCFTGLRVSDVRNLTWGDVKTEGQQPHLEIIMKKTQRPLNISLSMDALMWMPAKPAGASDHDQVFKLPQLPGVLYHLKTWGEAAGISMKLTTHIARHTFATLSLTAGVDLYTTSKLLGHTKVSTTQIYADIIDAKRVAAVNAISNLFNHESSNN